MPPKKKGKGKKSEKGTKKPENATADVKSKVSDEVLEEQIIQLREELDRENQERNYFQMERDKIQNIWRIADRQQKELEAEQKVLEKEIEEDELGHQKKIAMCKQEIKKLLQHHKKTSSNLESGVLHSTKAMQKEQWKLETMLHEEKRAIMIKTQEIIDENLMKRLAMEHDQDMTETMDSWVKRLTKIKAKYEKDMELVPQEVNNMRKKKTSEVEDHLKSHISDLKDDHKKDFIEVEALIHYVEDNMHMNSSLKKQITDLKLRQNEKDQAAVFHDNKLLSDLLLRIKREIEKAENEKRFNFCGLEKGANETLKKKKLRELKSDCEALEQKIKELHLEREEIINSMTKNILSVQEEEALKNDLLEGKLKALTDSLEETEAQVCSMLSASNLDRTALAGVINRIETNFDYHKNLPPTHLPGISTRKSPSGQRGPPSEYSIDTKMSLPRLTTKKVQFTKQTLKPNKLPLKHFPTISTKKMPAEDHCLPYEYSFMVVGESLPT